MLGRVAGNKPNSKDHTPIPALGQLSLIAAVFFHLPTSGLWARFRALRVVESATILGWAWKSEGRPISDRADSLNSFRTSCAMQGKAQTPVGKTATPVRRIDLWCVLLLLVLMLVLLLLACCRL